jgi:hypothetical protein
LRFAHLNAAKSFPATNLIKRDQKAVGRHPGNENWSLNGRQGSRAETLAALQGMHFKNCEEPAQDRGTR